MITWIRNPLTEAVHSADQRFRIVLGCGGWILCDYRAGAALMTGTESECRELAEAIERPDFSPLWEPKNEPENRGLSGPVADLVRCAERVAQSGGRLELLVAKRMPPELVKLELGILRKWSARLAERANETQPEMLS